MTDVPMPRLSDSMEEGTVLRWLKADGEQVARGEELVEIETDKATMGYESDADGVLSIVAPEGTTVPVGGVIARIGDGTIGSAQAAAEPAAPLARSGNGTGPVSASPLARRVASRLGVALEAVAGSGPRGRVLKADVVAAAAAPGRATAAATVAPVATAAPTGAKGETTVRALTRLQQTVARRMAESKATVPDFAVEMDVDMTAAVALRAQLKALADPAPSLNDLVVKAAALALRAHPHVNGSFRDGRFESYARVNVGLAVATDDGLVVPTVFDADRRSVRELAAEARRLAERVRSGTIEPSELSGGTFTVSNLGMFGVDRFAGVVNPPQAAILCVGAVTRRPAIAPDGGVEARHLMSLTLVSDHRILYGADAARFLADVRAALEAPLQLLAG